MLKKALSLLLALMMVFALGVTAFARDDDDDVVVKLEEDYVDVLYSNRDYYFDIFYEDSDGDAWEVDEDFMDDYNVSVRVTTGRSYVSASLEKVSRSRYQLVLSTDEKVSRNQEIVVEIRTRDGGRTMGVEEYTFELVRDNDSSDIDYEIDDEEWDVETFERVTVRFDDDIYRCTLYFGDLAYIRMDIGDQSRYIFEVDDEESVRVLRNIDPYADEDDVKFIRFATKTSFEYPATVGLLAEDGERYAYEIGDDYELTDLDATKRGDYLVFETDRVGYYIISTTRLDSRSSSSGSSNSGSSSGSGSSSTSSSDRITQSTLTNALNSVGTYGTASVRITNDSYVNVSDLKAAFQGNTGKMIQFVCYNGNSVAYQYYMNYRQVSAMTGTTYKLGMDLDAASTTNLFNKYFRNDISVVSSEAEINGAKAVFAVKMDLSGLNTSNLKVYIYDPDANRYDLVATPYLSIDANGYTHFTVPIGYDVILTDSYMTSK